MANENEPRQNPPRNVPPGSVPQDPRQPNPPQPDPGPRSFKGTVKDVNVTEPETPKDLTEEQRRRTAQQESPYAPDGAGTRGTGGETAVTAEGIHLHRDDLRGNQGARTPDAVVSPVQRHPVTGEVEAHPNPMLGTNPTPFAPVSLVNRVQGVIDEMARRPVTPVLTKAIAALTAVAEDVRAEDHPHPVTGPNPPVKGVR